MFNIIYFFLNLNDFYKLFYFYSIFHENVHVYKYLKNEIKVNKCLQIFNKTFYFYIFYKNIIECLKTFTNIKK